VRSVTLMGGAEAKRPPMDSSNVIGKMANHAGKQEGGRAFIVASKLQGIAVRGGGNGIDGNGSDGNDDDDDIGKAKDEQSAKKPKKEKKKPTKSKSNKSQSASKEGSSKKNKATSKPSASDTQMSPTVRRIRTEYKDVVDMGIAYDWVKGEPVRNRKSRAKAKKGESQDNPEALPLVLGPLSTNLKHWHFSFRGCGIYADGLYHGVIMLPKDYPATPPRVQMWTPSGRFQTHRNICLSASSFHPESWSPKWTILALVQCLRLHMLTNPQEIGSMTSTLDQMQKCAKESLSWKTTLKTQSQKHPKVVIDHGKMMEQKVFDFDDPADDTTATPSSTISGGSGSDSHSHSKSSAEEH